MSPRFEGLSPVTKRGNAHAREAPRASPCAVQACPLPTRDMAGDIPSRRRMLVVDDDEDSCPLLAELIRLSMPGTAVSTAHDGAGGLRLALMVAPSAVILDLEMPVLDGIEAAGAIRRALGGSPRLLALSGSARRLID